MSSLIDLHSFPFIRLCALFILPLSRFLRVQDNRVTHVHPSDSRICFVGDGSACARSRRQVPRFRAGPFRRAIWQALLINRNVMFAFKSTFSRGYPHLRRMPAVKLSATRHASSLIFVGSCPVGDNNQKTRKRCPNIIKFSVANSASISIDFLKGPLVFSF